VPNNPPNRSSNHSLSNGQGPHIGDRCLSKSACMGRNLNRQDAKCAKETQDESAEISFRASKLRFPSVWLGELGVLAVKQPLHSGFCHEALPVESPWSNGFMFIVRPPGVWIRYKPEESRGRVSGPS
jgi:hypothetical protein